MICHDCEPQGCTDSDSLQNIDFLAMFDSVSLVGGLVVLNSKVSLLAYLGRNLRNILPKNPVIFFSPVDLGVFKA